jgi:ABC-type sugar transport system ATPase subunit
MGRAIVREPSAFLMDEPLSNLDAQLRVSMRAEVSRIQRRLGVATVYVTHDQSEAMTLADVMVVMQDGVIMQHGAPRDLYESPQDEFVGWFLGAPGMNFLHLANDRSEVGRRVEGLWEPDLRARIVRAGNLGSIGFRPEYVRVALNPQHGWSEGIVQHAALTTCGQILLTAQVGTTTVVAKHAGLSLLSKGHRVWMRIPSEHVHFFGPDGQRMSLEPVVADEVDPEPVGSRPIPSV